MRIIIVDDELLAREMLAQMLTTLNKDIEIIALCADLPEGVKAINQYHPDVVFLDIDMPRFKGIEIDNFLPNINFHIIFTTAHQQFAIDAIKLGAFDYILKPIDIEEISTCLEKLSQKINKEIDFDKISSNRLIVNTIQNIHLIDFDKILYLQADGAYTKIVTEKNEITASKNLKHYEDILNNNSSFVRIHKSYIVNKSKINIINKLKQKIVLTNGECISITMDKIEKIISSI